jgi:hypothetical protein
MSTNTAKAKESGTPTKAQLKQLVRNDETFIGLYTAILASLHARRKVKEQYFYDEYEIHDICASLAKLAYIGACHGYAQLKLAEPDEEIEQFNAAVKATDSHNHH